MEKLLTIAGSDSSGGAGIQADLKTFAAHNVYGMSAITSATAQNTLGVTGVVDLPAEFIGKQIEAVFTDIYPDAVKIGMLSNKEAIKEIVRILKKYESTKIVVDPVMVSTSGSSLMKTTAVDSIIKELFPLADIITPNMDEASVLSGIGVKDKEDMEEAARLISSYLKGAILITGGHLEESSDDFLYIEGQGYWIKGKKLSNSNTHGTGCTLSSAIAVNLARGKSILEAVKAAKEYLEGAIKDNLDLGKGRGPLNHLYLNKGES